MLSVPTDSSREGSTTGTTGIACIEVALDGPIVGYIEFTPPRVIILSTGHLYRIAQTEAPVTIKTNSLSGLTSQRAKHCNYCKYRFLHTLEVSAIDQTIVSVALIKRTIDIRVAFWLPSSYLNTRLVDIVQVDHQEQVAGIRIARAIVILVDLDAIGIGTNAHLLYIVIGKADVDELVAHDSQHQKMNQ